MAVKEPPEGKVDEPKPPARLGRGGSISCCSNGRSFEKKLSHATLAIDEGGGLAGAVPASARREALTLALTRGDGDAESKRFSAEAALDEDEEEDAAELLLPDDAELPLFEADELPEDLDDEEESTDEETRRDADRVERGPQLEMKPLADADIGTAEGLAIAATAFLCELACLSRARAWTERPRILSYVCLDVHQQIPWCLYCRAVDQIAGALKRY
ncbi:hypothetical protein PHSY_007481 [Pseudozyma hubeiensis SY62]|uniref:Uncharacterized protein n=1 Tax=Pseudozyma hubeiensis (strain SY62) TaxID=1305764 RepID=R9PET1_PSEHS|nr:hypothetical protein PHSY_007481 [Pseudozyma hubeiensis SY62]GAC99878.1 hypothetical protein PHSY_007481 [Pseudozyma hubeiensis SY62]